jgi:hypothetical protein
MSARDIRNDGETIGGGVFCAGRGAPAKQSSLNHWKFSKAHIGSLFAHDFQISVHL